MASASTKTPPFNISDQFASFLTNPIQSRILRDAGIQSPSDPRFLDILRAASDFCYHAELYLPDPNDPSHSLHLEDWQYQELKYAQYGEIYLAKRNFELNLLQRFIPSLYLNPDHTFKRKNVAINSPRGFGKSVYSTVVPVEFCLHFNHLKVALFSTSQEQANDLITKVHYLISNSVFAFMITSSSKTEINLSNKCRIKSFPQSEVTIRGYHPHIKIIDEKSRIQREIIESAIRPMGRKSCWLEIGISTPFGRNNNHYEDCHNPEMFHIRNLNPTEVSWVDEVKLKKDSSLMGERIALQELYGQFLEDSSTVFKPSDIERMFALEYDHVNKYWMRLKPATEGRSDISYYLGCDFGKNHDYSAFCIVHENRNGEIIIDHLERHVNMDYKEVINRIFELCHAFNIKLIIPDGKGVGIAILDFLVDKVKVPIYTSKVKRNMYRRFEDGKKKPTEKKGFLLDNTSKMNLVGEGERILMLGKLKCPFHDNVSEKDTNNPLHIYKVLENEMINFSYTRTTFGNITFSGKDDGKNHDDTLIAVLFAIWGVKHMKAVNYALAGAESLFTYQSGDHTKIHRR